MSHPRVADLGELIRSLTSANVEFIVVGGAAAVLHGAPTTTQDLDIVHATSPDNVERLGRLLDGLDAIIREPGDRRLRPSQEHLAGQGQVRLTTSLGPLDLHCRLHDGRDFASLLSRTEVLTDGEIQIRVIDLPALIEIKASTGRARDQLVVPVLLSLLTERDNGGTAGTDSGDAPGR